MNTVNVQEVERTLRLLTSDSQTFEVRAIGAERGFKLTLSGFFRDPAIAAKEIASRCSNMVGVYTTLNPVRPELFARRANRIEKADKGETTSDHHILRRSRLLIDFDGVPVAGISASDEEHDTAIALSAEAKSELDDRGWPAPLHGDSGNGAHLDYAIDLPNDDDSEQLVERFLHAAHARWGCTSSSGVTVKVDTTNKNASRITKVFGTPARKGDDIPERPYRLSKILSAPDRLTAVTRDQIESFVADFAPKIEPKAKPANQSTAPGTQRLDVAQWLSKHGIAVRSTDAAYVGKNGAGTMYVLDECPFNSDHARGEAYVEQFDTGMIAAGCHHQSCFKNWQQLRERFDGPREQRRPEPQNQNQRELPEIVISTMQELIVDKAEQAIAAQGNVFQRGRMLVHVVRDRSVADWLRCPEGMPIIASLKSEHLRERIGSAARWLKIGKLNHLESSMVPPWVPKTLLERDRWNFPILHGVSGTPVLRPDGSIHDLPGYDPKSRIIYDPSGTKWPLMPSAPSREDATRALRDLADPFCDFPFVADCDRFAMIAFVLTVLARSAIDGNVPLFGVSANTPGSGKGLGVEICSIIATGEKASHMTPVNDDNEMRKRLFAIAIAAPRLANIDNVDSDLGCASLDAALTASSISDRVLGVSEIRSVPLTTVFSATGNNLSYRGDLARRVVPIEIDPGVEHPEDRAGFKYTNLEEHVRASRPRLVISALTLLRAFICAGKPSHSLPAKGSFEAWDRLVRGAIIWAGGMDPLGGVERLRQRGDASVERIAALLSAWSLTFGALAVTVAEAMRRASDGSDLREAMNAFGSKDRPINAQLLGTRLSKLRGRIVGGLVFEDAVDTTRDGSRLWKVVRK